VEFRARKRGFFKKLSEILAGGKLTMWTLLQVKLHSLAYEIIDRAVLLVCDGLHLRDKSGGHMERIISTGGFHWNVLS
jgi:hypothetical protein